MTTAAFASLGGIQELTDLDLDAVSGGRLSADGVASIGNAAITAGGIAAMVGAEPVAGFLVGFGVGCHLVAYMAS